MLLRLATEALTRGSGDNLTVIVAFLRAVDTLESVFKGGRQKHAATPTFYSSRLVACKTWNSVCIFAVLLKPCSVLEMHSHATSISVYMCVSDLLIDSNSSLAQILKVCCRPLDAGKRLLGQALTSCGKPYRVISCLCQCHDALLSVNWATRACQWADLQRSDHWNTMTPLTGPKLICWKGVLFGPLSNKGLQYLFLCWTCRRTASNTCQLQLYCSNCSSPHACYDANRDLSAVILTSATYRHWWSLSTSRQACARLTNQKLGDAFGSYQGTFASRYQCRYMCRAEASGRQMPWQHPVFQLKSSVIEAFSRVHAADDSLARTAPVLTQRSPNRKSI